MHTRSSMRFAAIASALLALVAIVPAALAQETSYKASFKNNKEAVPINVLVGQSRVINFDKSIGRFSDLMWGSTKMPISENVYTVIENGSCSCSVGCPAIKPSCMITGKAGERLSSFRVKSSNPFSRRAEPAERWI